MRIAIIVEHVHMRGGQERVVAELVRHLCARHEIHLFCFSAEDVPSAVRVHRLPCPVRSAILQSACIVLLSWLVVRPGRFDVVLSQGGNALNQNFTLVHTCHGLRVQDVRLPGDHRRPASPLRWLKMALRGWWATWMEGRAVRRCRGRTIAVSRTLKDYLVAQHGLRPAEVLVANNGVNHDCFNLDVRERYREQVRGELGVDADAFLVLFVGGLWFNKGLSQLIEVLSLMETPNARLLVVGSGDTRLFGDIARSRGVGDRVVFLPAGPAVERYYAAADCFALLSASEGFGLVAAEAAACGLPVVMTRVGVAEELVEDGVSGFIVSQSPTVVAERLDALASDPELRASMGREAHLRARSLTWNSQALAIEELFEQWRCGARQSVEAGGAPAGPRGGSRLRIAVISHSCVVPANQGLYEELARYQDAELMVLTPLRWWSQLSGPVAFRPLPGAADICHPLPVHLPGQIHLHWYGNARLQSLLDDFAPDVLLVDEEPYSLAAWQGKRMAERLGCKLVVFTKENLRRRYPLPLGLIQRAVLRRCDHLVAMSAECEEVARQKGYRGSVSLLPHGIDPRVFTPRSQTRLRRWLGLNGPVVGYVGRLTEEKGVLDLVGAAGMAMHAGCPRFQLCFIGDGPLYGRVESEARSLLGPGAAVIVANIPHEAIHDYMGCLDILVLPSRTTPRWKEQFGRVLIESLACQVPVIGSSSGHIPHLIADTGGGLVFKEGNREELAEKIADLLGDPEQARQYAERGRRRVLEMYTWEAVAGQLHQALQGLATRSTARA